MIFSKATLVFLLFFIVHLSSATASTAKEIVNQLHVPNARSLALGDNGIVFVGSGREEKVYALQNIDQEGNAEQRYIFAKI